MYPEDEKQVRDSAVEHIEEAAIADGLDSGAKAQPEQSKEPLHGRPARRTSWKLPRSTLKRHP